MADSDIYRLATNECLITNPTGTAQAVVLEESLDVWLAKGWTKWARGVATNPKPGLATSIKHFH